MSNITDALSIRFSSLQELLQWHNSNRGAKNCLDSIRIPREEINNYSRIRENTGKTELKVMVCHDYKGNYQPEEDENPLGYFPHSTGEHYFLQFPSLVDIFIYFSHTRITVPPVSWINSLHRHGIPVLGTIIVEGTQLRLLDELVEKDENDTNRFKYVEPLVELAKHYKFDGWLINIETNFSVISKAKDLLLFVEQLRSEIHRSIPGSQIVWYDAFVTDKNRVFYQNGVTSYNYDHFETSDLFFSNYWWDEETLRKNILNVGMQGVSKKLYSGIDIWGRGSKVGNGGFETGVAINFLRFYSSNIALFAPAWTYENFPKEEFISKDQQFWIGEEKNPGGSISTYIQHSTAPVYQNGDDILFYTNFSQGEGNGFNISGLNVFNDKWVNGNLQLAVPSGLKEGVCEVSKEERFNGGSSLKITVDNESKGRIVELFQFQNDVTSNSLNISISFKSLSKLPLESKFQLEIKYYIERRYRSITKVKDGVSKFPLKFSKNWKSVELICWLPRLQAREHLVLSGVQLSWSPEGISEENSDDSWVIVPNQENRINKEYQVLIGDLLIESTHLKRAANPITKLIDKIELNDDGEVLVRWKDQENILYWFVFVDNKFVGVANTSDWIVQRRDRLRIDCFTRSGKVIKGNELFI